MFERILVCLDGSELAEQTLPYATELVRRLGGKMVLLEVTAPPSVVTETPGSYYRKASLSNAQRGKKEATDYLRRLARPMQEQELDVECLTLPGSPGETIASYAEENDISLIVLGTRGWGGPKHLTFGSVADYILKRSSLPVLVIRPQPPSQSGAG